MYTLESYFVINNASGTSVYVTELSGMYCIRYVCVTQHKDPKEELLRALLEASKLLI